MVFEKAKTNQKTENNQPLKSKLSYRNKYCKKELP